MKPLISCIAACLALTAGISANAQENELGWTMESAVKQLDRQGSDFESVLADFDVEWSDGAPSEPRIESGRLYITSRDQLRVSSESPKTQVMILDGRTLYFHDPAAATVLEISLYKNKDRLEVFIPLGFNITGKDLSKDYLVTFIGEKIVGTKRTLGLELTPKEDDVRAVMARMEIWVDEASWLPVQQIITQAGGGETLTLTYRGTARNLSLNSDLFSTRWPRDTETEKM